MKKKMICFSCLVVVACGIVWSLTRQSDVDLSYLSANVEALAQGELPISVIVATCNWQDLKSCEVTYNNRTWDCSNMVNKTTR